MNLRFFYHFFLLSRPLNILITAFVFAFSAWLATDHQLDFLQSSKFYHLLIQVLVVTAGGYWVNDAFDFKIDAINKKGKKLLVNEILSTKKVFTAYFALNFLLTLSFLVTPWMISVVLFLSVGLLFLYAWLLKRLSFVGNVTIAAMSALVVWVAVFVGKSNFYIVFLSIFAFEISLMREIVKDIEDIRGDYFYGLHTLPIHLGIRWSKRFVFVMTMIFITSLYLPLIYVWFAKSEFDWLYLLFSLFLVQIPSIYFAVQLAKAVKKSDFSKLSRLLKLLMLSGMLSVGFLG